MIPLIDIEPLTQLKGDRQKVARELAKACRDWGFFYITGHGVSRDLQQRLEQLSWQFFRQSQDQKMEISMEKGGRAWRGYFPLEAELTSGQPDLKEGLYFGEELPADHPLVKTGTPMHGSNLFPDIPGFEEVVLNYVKSMTRIGELLMQGMALSLELPIDFFRKRFMKAPLTLFRIFHYPPASSENTTAGQWGVGEHTDYGVLTILKQDAAGGLQVYAKEKWIEAPYIENCFVCNIGDMLDLMTRGYYRSTPHRVLNTSQKGRLSFPFFFDLDFHSRPQPIDLSHLGHAGPLEYRRWDEASLQAFSGTYGSYLLQKVSRVFPQLGDNLL